MFVDATVFVLLLCCRPRNRFEIIQKMNIRKRRPFQIDPCCCCCWGWPFCCSLFPAVPFWTWLLVCCEHAADSLRFSVAMMERKDEEIGRVTTPSLVKARCPSHCSLSRPASFIRFFLGAENLFVVWSRQPVKKLLYLVDLFIIKLKTKCINRWQQYLS